MMVVAVFGFDCDRVHNDGVKCIKFRKRFFYHMEVELSQKKKKKKYGEKVKGVEGMGLSIFCFIKDIDCNGVSKWKGRTEKRRGKRKGRGKNPK